MQSLGEIFANSSSFLGRVATLGKLRAVWPQVVGSHLAEQSFVHSLKRGILYVHVADSVWLSEMRFLEVQIMKNLSKQSGIAIQQIRCRLGRIN